jgi:hypothetical protein
MKITPILIALSFSFCGASCPASVIAAAGNTLTCNIGPLAKSYGGGQWLVYGCSDGKSVVLITQDGTPGAPFIFSFLYTGEKMTLHGEGTGNQQATDAAFKELNALSQADVAALFQQAKARAARIAG